MTFKSNIFHVLAANLFSENKIVDVEQICPPIFWAFFWEGFYVFISLQLKS